MLSWNVFIAIMCIVVVSLCRRPRGCRNLPPGPRTFPIIGNIPLLLQPMARVEAHLLRFMARHGPLVSLKFGDRTMVYIGSHSLAHRALVRNGAAFADRPDITPTLSAINKKLLYINSVSCGPTWRLLRRNITRETIQPAQNRAYSDSRRQILTLLISRLSDNIESSSSVRIVDYLHHTITSFLGLMCFGERLPERQIIEICSIVHRMEYDFLTISLMHILPRLGRILFRHELQRMIKVHEDADRVFIPLIRARIQATKAEDFVKGVQISTYVDTLVDLHLPEYGRTLEEEEIVSLCGELFIAGSGTTTNTIEWIMANLVKYPECQNRLYEEIKEVVGKAPPIKGGEERLEKVVEEGEFEKMPYLKAVVLEGLRLHPPSHFVVPHKMKEDAKLDGYTIPKNTIVNFMVAGMGRDPNVWEDPLEFKPERFLSANEDAFDITGNREIKMMPFGVGRRICPGLWLGMHHMQYVVANLIWYFKWSPVEGDEVDLSEKVGFIVIMKNPLQAHASTRI